MTSLTDYWWDSLHDWAEQQQNPPTQDQIEDLLDQITQDFKDYFNKTLV